MDDSIGKLNSTLFTFFQVYFGDFLQNFLKKVRLTLNM